MPSTPIPLQFVFAIKYDIRKFSSEIFLYFTINCNAWTGIALVEQWNWIARNTLHIHANIGTFRSIAFVITTKQIPFNWFVFHSLRSWSFAAVILDESINITRKSIYRVIVWGWLKLWNEMKNNYWDKTVFSLCCYSAETTKSLVLKFHIFHQIQYNSFDKLLAAVVIFFAMPSQFFHVDSVIHL